MATTTIITHVLCSGMCACQAAARFAHAHAQVKIVGFCSRPMLTTPTPTPTGSDNNNNNYSRAVEKRGKTAGSTRRRRGAAPHIRMYPHQTVPGTLQPPLRATIFSSRRHPAAFFFSSSASRPPGCPSKPARLCIAPCLGFARCGTGDLDRVPRWVEKRNKWHGKSFGRGGEQRLGTLEETRECWMELVTQGLLFSIKACGSHPFFFSPLASVFSLPFAFCFFLLFLSQQTSNCSSLSLITL